MKSLEEEPYKSRRHGLKVCTDEELLAEEFGLTDKNEHDIHQELRNAIMTMNRREE